MLANQQSSFSATLIPRLLRDAAAQQKQGRLQEAAQYCQSALRRDPTHAGALRLLGVIRSQQGRLEQAARLLRKAAYADPSSPEVYNNLGTVLNALDRQEEAIACYRQALAIRPHYPMALNNLGIALARLERHGDAVICYEDALMLQPEYAEALSNLGTALHVTGRYEQAAERFRAALMLRPDLMSVEINLGNTLRSLGRLEEASTCYRSVLAREPSSVTALTGLAASLRARHDDEGAIATYRAALQLAPTKTELVTGLGEVLQETGQLAEAAACFERAMEIEPRRPGHYLALTQVRTLTEAEPRYAALMALGNDLESFDDKGRMALHFALGRTLAHSGRREEAFTHLQAGNALRRGSISYDEAAAIQHFDRIRSVFTPGLVESRAGFGDPSATPIFIVGMPRSGSTLLEQMLASHPMVRATGETDSIVEAGRDAGLFGPDTVFPDTVPAWTGEQVRRLARCYLDRMEALTGSPEPIHAGGRITDKMLANFEFVGLIRLMLPNARIIHMVRDPVDTCLSCFSIPFQSQPFSFDLGELGRYYQAYAQLMDHWRSILPTAMLEIRYESLVEDAENQLRRIVGYCGLPWDDACLRFYETPRPVRTASAAQVRRPLYRDSLRRWRPPAEVLRPLIEGLGIAALP